MAQTDRTTGLVGEAGVKVPVRACTTAAIVLSGEQTIDGVALVTGDRVLVNNQASSVDNGIYKVDTGAWSRTLDCDGSYDLVQGSMVHVYGGTTNGNKVWRCTTANSSATNPYVVIGTASIVFAAMDVQLTGSNKTVWCGTATGGPNALVLTPATVLAAGDIVAGLTLLFKKDAADNNAASTINVSGTGALAAQADGAAMVGGEMKASKWFAATLDGTGAAYQVQQIAPATLLSLITTAGDILVGTAAGKMARKAVPANGYVRMADSAQADGWQDVPAAFAFKNRLINPDARIYVRAAAATANSTYFANNWYLLSQTGTCLPSALADPEDGYPAGVRITQSQAAAQRFGFAQVIEGRFCKDLRGKSGVLVPRIRASAAQNIRYAILGWTGTEDTVTRDVVNDWTSGVYTTGNFFKAASMVVLATGVQLPGANVWTSLAAITGALGSAFNNIIIMVWTEGTAAQNFTLDFDYVQFERGSVATEFERRPFTVEDQMCQRYLPSFVLGNSTTETLGVGHCVSTSLTDVVVPYKVEARAIPTALVVSAATDFSIYDGFVGTSALTAIALSAGAGPSKHAVGLRTTCAGTPFTARDPAILIGNTGSGYRAMYLTGAEL